MRSVLSMPRVLTLIYIALFPVLPNYFRIWGIESGLVLSALYVATYVLTVFRRLKINKKLLSVICVYAVLTLLPAIAHRQITTMLYAVIEYFGVMVCLTHFFTSVKEPQKAINEAMHVILYSCCVMCIFGVIDAVAKENVFWVLFNGKATDLTPGLQMRGVFARSEATFGHAITFGIYLSFCGLIATYYLIKEKRKKYGAILSLIVITLLLTVSRGPILFFSIAELCFLYLLGLKKFLVTLLKVISMGVAIIVALCLIFPEVFEIVSNIIFMVGALFSEDMAAKLTLVENNDPFWYRFGLFYVIPQHIKNNILFGNGIDLAFRFEYGGFQYYSVDNGYLYTLLISGIVGLSGFLFPMIYTVKVNAKKRTRRRYAEETSMFIAIVLCYALNLFSVAQMAEFKLWLVIFSFVCSNTIIHRRELVTYFKSGR